MNCANHSLNPVAAYCRTCGKPLCSSCTRQVMGVVYCENCLAARVSGTPVSTPYPSGPGGAPRMQPSSGPHPGVAGILAGFFPFGVGAVYCGQYIKGLVHLVIFILLIVGQVNTNSDGMHVVLGLSIGAYYFYQLIDAIRCAKAIQLGQTAPDPFGLNTMFGPGERIDASRGIPAGAVILIALGILFLLHNLINWFDADLVWPALLIFLGVWLYAKRKMTADGCGRSIMAPVFLVTIGALWLISDLPRGPGFGQTWPVILLVLGVIKLMERGYLGGPPPTPPIEQAPGSTSSTPQSSTEVNSEVKNG